MFDDHKWLIGGHSRTFADDSFKTHDVYSPAIDAQLPEWVDLTWYIDLRRRFTREFSWSFIRRHWDSFSTDLQHTMLRCIREALIVIVDPSIYRSSMEHIIEEVVGKSREKWPAGFEEHVQRQLTPDYVGDSILADSPATRIQDFLEDDGIYLGDPGGIDGNTDPTRSILSDLKRNLRNTHNIRLFGARSAAAFVHLVDPDSRREVVRRIIADMRYLPDGGVDAILLAAGDKIQRVFDEGNTRSVGAIADLQNRVRERLVRRGNLVLLPDAPRDALELPSDDYPVLQAADIAAGYAADLYAQVEGLRTVCEEFKGVILNGAMVRDWKQVDRPDATALRLRR